MTGLLVDTQPANLIKRAGSSLSATERDVMRAQIVRNYLKGDDQ
jgi:protein-arginine kinase